VQKPIVAVADTNVLVSAILRPQSVSAEVVNFLLAEQILLFSTGTLEEACRVLFRHKFDQHVSRAKRDVFFKRLCNRATIVIPTEIPETSRDEKDDVFLAIAVTGQADVIISGDKDLQVLHPFRNIPILSPRQFLQEVIYFEKK
jgi:putative PIN family toxin of toxin-antitoxin system